MLQFVNEIHALSFSAEMIQSKSFAAREHCTVVEYGSVFLCTEVVAVSETSLPSYPTTHCNISDACSLYQYGNTNPKSRFYKPGELNFGVIFFPKERKCRSQLPRGLKRRSAAARLLRLWVRIPPDPWMPVYCECCVFSGRDLCDELIIRPEESYRMWCVVVCDLET